MTDRTDAGTVLEAAQSGDRQRLLRALRQRLAVALDDVDTHPRDVASVARVLREVDDRLAELADTAPEPDPDPSGLEEATETPPEPFPGLGA